MIVDNPVEKLWKTRGKLVKNLHNITRYVLCMIYCWNITSYFAQEQLSPLANISLLTCDPGPELYATFGHTCFRINDPVNRIDEVYNYGTFDFSTPNFYLKFIRGKLNYMLSKATYERFRYEYTYTQRPVLEQVLNLTQDQKQAFYEHLYTNFLPENRYYLYDYFFNNCATQPRDVILEVLEESIVIDSLHISTDRTLRTLIDEYLQSNPWADFGIDLILGKKIDQPSTPFQHMFLPDYLMKEMSEAKIMREGTYVPLVLEDRMVVTGPPRPGKYEGFLTPTRVSWALLVLILGISMWGFTQNRAQRWVDAILFSIVGLAGIVMLVMWLGTDHTAASQNLNLLWAIPIHIVIAPAILSTSYKRINIYFLVNAILLLVLLGGTTILPQSYHSATLPIIIILIIRSLYRWQYHSTQT